MKASKLSVKSSAPIDMPIDMMIDRIGIKTYLTIRTQNINGSYSRMRIILTKQEAKWLRESLEE